MKSSIDTNERRCPPPSTSTRSSPAQQRRHERRQHARDPLAVDARHEVHARADDVEGPDDGEGQAVVAAAGEDHPFQQLLGAGVGPALAVDGPQPERRFVLAHPGRGPAVGRPARPARRPRRSKSGPTSGCARCTAAPAGPDRCSWRRSPPAGGCCTARGCTARSATRPPRIRSTISSTSPGRSSRASIRRTRPSVGASLANE